VRGVNVQLIKDVHGLLEFSVAELEETKTFRSMGSSLATRKHLFWVEVFVFLYFSNTALVKFFRLSLHCQYLIESKECLYFPDPVRPLLQIVT
jgi:hypothetical protein